MPTSVLVTGANGFVGSHLLRALVAMRPQRAIAAWARRLRRSPADPPRGSSQDADVTWRQVDVLDADAVTTALSALNPAEIYHCAGVASVHGSWSTSVSTLETNVIGTRNLLQAVMDANMSPTVLIPGSALVYAPSTTAIGEDHALQPTSPYGLSKLAQEMLGMQFCEYGLRVLLTRSFTHIGPGQAPTYAASSFARQIALMETGRLEPVVKVGHLGAQRDLTDVRDTVRAYIALMDGGRPGVPYNVCRGRALAIGDVLDRLVAQARIPLRVEQDSSRLRPQDNLLLLGDASRIHDAVGWRPTISLDDTLRDLLEYWRHVVRENGH